MSTLMIIGLCLLIPFALLVVGVAAMSVLGLCLYVRDMIRDRNAAALTELIGYGILLITTAGLVCIVLSL